MGAASQSTIETGLAQARRILGRAPVLAAPSEMTGALQRVAVIEQKMGVIRDKLLSLDAAGLATQADFDGWNKSRLNLYRTQRALFDPIRDWLRENVPSLVPQLPNPQPAPELHLGDGAAWRASRPAHTPETRPPEPLMGLGGRTSREMPARLGAAPLAVAGAACVADLPVCFIVAVVALLVAAGVLATIAVALYLTAEQIRDVLVTQEQVEAYERMLTERREIYDECRGTGGDPAHCAETAATLVPTPQEAGVELPPGPGEQWAWVPFAVGAAAVLALIGGGLYVYGKERGQYLDGFRNPRPKRLRRGRRPGPRRDYQLEVED